MILHNRSFGFCLIPLLFCNLIIQSSCTKDKVPEPLLEVPCNYSKEVRQVLLLKCAVPACHTMNFPFGNFSNYSDLRSRIVNGKFSELVFKLRLMPPAGSDTLTQEDFNILSCWINNGFPED